MRALVDVLRLMKRFVVFLLVTVSLACAEAAADPPIVGVTPTLPALLVCMREANPRVRAQTDRVAAAGYDAVAVDGFYDTTLSAAAGLAEGAMRTPGSILPGVAPAEAWVTEVTATRPLRQGFLLKASLARWDSFGGGAAINDSATIAGAALEKPLLRDRGFARQRLEREAAQQGVEIAQAWRQVVWQDTCHAMTHAYVDWLAAHAEMTESIAASGRVARLLHETETRVRLDATPSYQLASARMEVAFRQDDLHRAQAALLATRIRLAELAGGVLPADVLRPPEADELRRWADACASTGRSAPFTLQIPERPEWRMAATAAAQADTLVRRAREDLKADLSIFGGVGWRLNNVPGSRRDSDMAWEAGIVWRSPLGYDSEKALAAARAADASASRSDLAATISAVVAEFERARTSFESACERLASIDRAVEEARASLEAESERLRLGEGRSRLVLDAQKDLSAANRSANTVAAQTIRAYTDQARAAGISFASFRATP